MKAIVTVVEKISSEAHIDIPDGLAESGIRQQVVDHYNSGEMLPLLNIFHVDCESISVSRSQTFPKRAIANKLTSKLKCYKLLNI